MKPDDSRVDLCRYRNADTPRPLWPRIAASRWAGPGSVSVRDAFRTLGLGSTAGAKLVASGVLPTVEAVGYVNPRVALSTLELMTSMPTLDVPHLQEHSSTLIVRCGGPQRDGVDNDPADVDATGRAYFGFHLSMTTRQAVAASACWWKVAVGVLGIERSQVSPGSWLQPSITRLWVTVGGLIVLDGAVQHVAINRAALRGEASPLVGFVVADPPEDMAGHWLPKTASGATVLRARDW